MILVWQAYNSDLGRAYPMFALSSQQVNDVPTDKSAIALIPPAISSSAIEGKYPCAVDQLTPRFLTLWASDGAQFRLSYPQPFSQNLYDYLTLNTEVAAFEFVGERLRYGRLRRLLDYVRS